MLPKRLIYDSPEAFDFLRKGAELMTASAEKKQDTTASTESEQGILSRIMEFTGMKSPEAVKQGQEVAAEAKEKRQSLLGETVKSLRQHCPRMLVYFDLVAPILDKTGISERLLGGDLKDPEDYPFENEFEFISALAFVLPGKEYKKYVTDMFAKSEMFQKIVANYPLLEGIPLLKSIPGINGIPDLRKQIKEGDPDAIILFLRIVHQDVLTGKEGASKIWDTIKSSGGGLLDSKLLAAIVSKN